MKLSKLTTLVFVLGAILYSSKVDAQNVPNILESARESRLLLVQVNSQDPKAYHNRGFARSKLASMEIFIDSNDAAEAYVYQSVARILSGDLKGAIEDCNQAIRLNPNYALAYNNRGFARLLSGDLKEAIENFTQALSIDPSLAITHNNRGFARFKIGDLKGAIEDFTQALSIDPSLALAQNSQDCSVCGTRVQKTLSTRTHQCPNCQTVLDRDRNAAINILKKGLQYLGNHLNGTVGQTETDPNALGESGLWVFSGDIENHIPRITVIRIS